LAKAPFILGRTTRDLDAGDALSRFIAEQQQPRPAAT
jgi:hypothetical protein